MFMHPQMFMHTPSGQILSSPRLPPEILEQIFSHFKSYVKFTETTGPGITELDLMAASMVCREWYHVAEPILAGLDTVFRTLPSPEAFSIFYLRHSNVKHHRLTSLLTTAHQLGLPHADNFKDLLIKVAHVDFFEEGEPNSTNAITNQKNHDDIFTILRLTNLTTLRLAIEQPHMSILQSRSPTLRDQFFTKLSQHCSGISELHLKLKSSGNFVELPFLFHSSLGLASVVLAMTSSLTTLELKGLPDTATLEKLSCLTHLRSVTLKSCHIYVIADILHGSRELRSIKIIYPIGQATESLFAAMDGTSNVLEELVLKHMDGIYKSYDPATGRAFQALVSRCPRLRRLSIKGGNYMERAVFRAMGRHCPNLEVLSLCNCLGMSLTSDLRNTLGRWQRLHILELTSMMVYSDFVIEVAKVCRALRRLELPIWTVLDDFGNPRRDIIAVFQESGFENRNVRELMDEKKFSTVWERLVG